MTTRIASPASTGGRGYVYEDHVISYFLICMLAGEPPLNSEGLGILERIDLQTKSIGWLLDDILLTFQSPEGSIRAAFSIKSSQQFVRNAAPADFVEEAWEQFLGNGQSVFSRGVDRLGLISPSISEPLRKDLNTLINS